MKPYPADRRYAWTIAAASIFIVMGAVGFARFGYTMILPRMVVALQLTDTQAGAAATANMIGYLIFSLIGGVLATRYGPRIVIIVSIGITALALFGTGLAETYRGAALWRFLAGAGGGGANVPMMGLISGWFTAKRRGLASGIAVGGSSLALLFTGVVLPRVMSAGGDSGWRNGWYLLGIITVTIAVAALFYIKNAPEPVGDMAKHIPLRRHARSRWLWMLSGVYFLFGFSYVIFATFYARYLVSEAGLTEKAAGALWSLIGGISIASGFLWGAASDKIGRGKALAGIFFIQALAYGIFAGWKAMPGYVLSTVLFGLTAWSIPAVMGAAVGDAFGGKAAPAVFGVVTLVFGVGQALGPALAGKMADTFGSFTPAFATAASVAAVGALLSFFLRVPRTSTPGD